MISICVPIYNTEKYIERCVRSLMRQTYSDLEIILVDDGSTDNTSAICDELKKQDNRIRVFHKENGGEASARNVGLKNATGEWVAFIDSDDEYLETAMEELITTAEKYETELSVSGYIEIGKEERLGIAHQKIYDVDELAYMLFEDNGSYGDKYIFSTVNAKLFRTSVIRECGISFNEQFRVGNDSLFMCEYLKNITKVSNTLSATYIYYKYDISERLQGTSWVYPDMFVLIGLWKDKMYSIANRNVCKISLCRLIPTYMDVIKGLVNLFKHEKELKADIKLYLMYCKKNLSFFQNLAEQEVMQSLIIDKYKNGIPYELVSYLIYKEKNDELIFLLRTMQEMNSLNEAEENSSIRRMITLV